MSIISPKMGLIVSWVVIPLSILLITGPVAASIFMALLERGQWRRLAIFWLALGFTTILLGIFIAHTFGNFIPGPGCFISLFTPPAAIVTFLVLRFRARRVHQALGSDSAWRRRLLVGTLLIPLLQLSAPVINFSYGRTCDLLNRQAAKPLIAALEAYKTETGSYLPPDSPDSPYQGDLKFLTPDYLTSIPPRACNISFFNSLDPSYRGDDDWNLYLCNNNPGRELLLMVPIIGSDSQQLYNLNTGHWSRGNSLDGYCN